MFPEPHPKDMQYPFIYAAQQRGMQRSNVRTFRGPSASRLLKAKKGTKNGKPNPFAGQEKKFMDISRTGATVSQSWTGSEVDDTTMLCLNGIAQGVTEVQRVGRTAHIDSIQLRGTVSFSSSEGNVNPLGDVWVRIIVFIDYQSNMLQADAEAVMSSVGANLESESFRNLEFVGRFRVLFDKTINMSFHQMFEASNMFAFTGLLRHWRYKHEFVTPLKVVFDASGATIADITTNSLHIAAVGNSSNLDISYTSRIRFYG